MRSRQAHAAFSGGIWRFKDCALDEGAHRRQGWRRVQDFLQSTHRENDQMFMAGSLILLGGIAWYAERSNARDRSSFDYEDNPFHFKIRQDLKLIELLIEGILVMLGVVADRFGQ